VEIVWRSILLLVLRYKATEKCAVARELVIESDDPGTAVKALDAMAYTIWNECGCKHDGDGRKRGCDNCRMEHCCEAQPTIAAAMRRTKARRTIEAARRGQASILPGNAPHTIRE
jgi:hypothetical protein